MADVNFGNRLKRLRITHNLTQDSLAAALNVSRRAVTGWEHGTKLPSYDSIIALCLYFHVSADHLLGLA